ncbi:hypothetical protein NQ317_017414 [Molorchus minor]|uniref:ZP domain-containing protein n=1 Tax=Molorchus minor TaxID=1323400 RepID=A0ABQ9JIA3_9CUCU|nr:hypothetical protein NQ317_017414 [Molorchus minor]
MDSYTLSSTYGNITDCKLHNIVPTYEVGQICPDLNSGWISYKYISHLMAIVWYLFLLGVRSAHRILIGIPPVITWFLDPITLLDRLQLKTEEERREEGKLGYSSTKTEETSVPIAVRIHRTLELADDKFYVIKCGKAGFINARNETSQVSIRVVDANGRKIVDAVYSRPYTLRAELSKPDGTYGFRVKNCLAFNRLNSSVSLIDERGCPVNKDIISPFTYDDKKGTADAQIRSIFRFSDGSELHLQCEMALCRDNCPLPSCDGPSSQPLNTDKGVLMAATNVFVLDPGQAPQVQELCEDGEVHPSWLLWLAVALGVLFLLMLIINIFLCSAMTCACARTEIIEKEPSIIEDYDPYRSWHGSQYGSRYSLNGAPQHPKGYTSGGSTMNSTRSVSSHSDHYAIVHSRPGSRGYSKHRGPPSHIGSHYSGK